MFRSLVIVTALAIPLAMPAAAQQLTEQEAQQAAQGIVHAFNKAAQNHDAAGLAALYTEDAILVTPFGPQFGRAAIQKHASEAEGSPDWSPDPAKLVQVKVIGNDVILRTGSWSGTLRGPNGPTQLSGYWATTDVREGGTWKIRMETYNMT